MEKEPKKIWTMNDAMSEIAVLEEIVRKMGAVDREIDDLNQIRRELQSGYLKPEEAVERAEEVRRERMDYH